MANDPIWGDKVMRLPGAPRPAALWQSGDDWDEAKIPPRPWVIPRYIIRGSVSLCVGTGSAGKSMLFKAWAVAAALGRDYGRFKCSTPLRVLTYNVEDDLDEEHRRISAALRQFDATPADLMGNLRIVGPTDIGTLVVEDAPGQFVLTDAMNDLEDIIREFQPDIVELDPLVELHTAEENDNTSLRAVAAQFRGLAKRHNCGVMLAHHTRKGAVIPGDPDASRGAGSIIGACRVVMTVCHMSEEDAQEIGVPAPARKNYFRVDDAKANYHLAGDPEWFERVPYLLANDEIVPAAEPWIAPTKTMSSDQYLTLLHAIASAKVPLSPRLSNDPRSFAEACRAIGVMGKEAQRKILSTLMTEHGVTEAHFTRPGKAVGDTAIGLRTATGQPELARWED